MKRLRSQLNEWKCVDEIWDYDDTEALKLADNLLARVKEQS